MDRFEWVWWKVKAGFVVFLLILVIDFVVWLAKNRGSPHLNDYLACWGCPYFCEDSYSPPGGGSYGRGSK